MLAWAPWKYAVLTLGFAVPACARENPAFDGSSESVMDGGGGSSSGDSQTRGIPVDSGGASLRPFLVSERRSPRRTRRRRDRVGGRADLFGDSRQALLIHALDGPDQVSQAIWLWRYGFGIVSPEFVGFRFDYDTGATYGELQVSAEQPDWVRVREWVDCAPFHDDARGCQPQRWEALWQFGRGFFIETERHHWLGPDADGRAD